MERTRSSLALLVSATVLASCGGGGPVVPADAAEALAAQADAVARLVDEGDGCGAEEQAAALREDIESQRGAALTEPVADELAGAVSDLEAQIECTPPEPDPPPADDGDRGGGNGDDDDDDDDDDDEGDNGRGGGNGRGNEKKDDEGEDD